MTAQSTIRKRLVSFVKIGLLLGIGFFLLLRIIHPPASVILTGNFDPSIMRVYINNRRVVAADIGVRKFTFNKFPGTYKILVSGPIINTMSSTLHIKPLFGGTQRIAISAGPSVEKIAASSVHLNEGQSIVSAQPFADGWIGVILKDPAAYYAVVRALHYTYETGNWTVINPDSRLDTSQAVFKNAPLDLIAFLTDTAAD